MTRYKKENELFLFIMALYVLLAFCTLAMAANVLAIVKSLLHAVAVGDLLVMLELLISTGLCSFLAKNLLRYKMREYAEVKLNLLNMKLTDTLHNCSECNAVPRYIINVGSFLNGIRPSVSIVCSSCGCYSDICDSAEQAVRCWNLGYTHCGVYKNKKTEY